MNYEVVDTNWIGAPKLKATDPTKVEVNVQVTTGIVNETYGFVKNDMMVAEFLVSETGIDAQVSVDAQAAAFSAAKYPNT